MSTQTLNKFTWWDSLTPLEKQNLTNNFYCKFRQFFFGKKYYQMIQVLCFSDSINLNKNNITYNGIQLLIRFFKD